MDLKEAIQKELKKTTQTAHYNGWNNFRTSYGYHSYDIDDMFIQGQRNPKRRLEYIRQHIDLTNKVVYDFGCNVGAMLHHMPEIKQGVGFDYDGSCIEAGNNISKLLGIDDKVNLFKHDFDKDDYDTLRYNMIKPIDVSFLLALGSWVKTWPKLYGLVNAHSKVIILETNNDKEGKAQLDFFKELGRTITLVSNMSDDDVTGNHGRKTYMIK
jgi:SAM-dependent methyltransferase